MALLFNFARSARLVQLAIGVMLFTQKCLFWPVVDKVLVQCLLLKFSFTKIS